MDNGLSRLLKFREFAAELHGVVKPLPFVSSPQPASTESSAPHREALKSIDDLVVVYRGDDRSPYHQLRHKTRENYDSLVKRILQDCAGWKLADLRREDFEQLYA